MSVPAHTRSMEEADSPGLAAVERRLRGLDGAARTALAADVFAARGFETRVEGGVVVAQRGDRRRRVRVDGAATDGRRLDTAALAEMLYYGVDRAERDRLCERHLGAAPAGLDTRRGRLADRVSAGHLVVAALFVCALAATAVAVGGSLGVDGTAGRTGEGTGTGPSAAVDPVTPPAATGSGVSEPFPPGLGPSGVTNATALAAAHDRALGDRSYTLWVDLARPRDGEAGAERVRWDMDFAVAADGRYRLEQTLRRDEGWESAKGGPDQTIVHDGRARFVVTRTNGTVEYTEAGGRTVAPDPAILRRTLVTRYLRTAEASVERTDDGDYVLTGRGRPSVLPRQGTTNYSVRAVVRQDGLVERLGVRGTLADADDAVSFDVTYARVGATTVELPERFEP